MFLGFIVKISILSFYSFVNICEKDILLSKILLISKKKFVKGTILLATEGFNGSICGSAENVKLVLDNLIELTGATDINVKENFSNTMPFDKMKVKLKKEIVTLGIEDIDPKHFKGTYIETKDWDEFIRKEEVILIDTRNDYEVEIGSFEGAVNPSTETFRELPKWISENIDNLKNKKVAMYCTGGIRCEKSTALLRKLGHSEVYHLKGGILQYLEDTKNVNNLWKGNCFVFDNRMSVDINLNPETEL